MTMRFKTAPYPLSERRGDGAEADLAGYVQPPQDNDDRGRKLSRHAVRLRVADDPEHQAPEDEEVEAAEQSEQHRPRPLGGEGGGGGQQDAALALHLVRRQAAAAPDDGDRSERRDPGR